MNAAGTDGGNGASTERAITPDGRYVAFTSTAGDLGPSDTNGLADVYRRDLWTGQTILVSVNAAGNNGANAASGVTLMSADGRYVAFRTAANDLGPADAGFDQDIYLRDIVAGTTRLVTVNADGSDGGNAPAGGALDMTPDGRYIVFTTNANNLGPPDAGSDSDVYIRDTLAGTTRMVSVNAAGTDGGNGPIGSTIAANRKAVSDDGRFVAFETMANDLGVPDAGLDADIYVRDLWNGTTRLASSNDVGTDGGNGPSTQASISADGRHVAFLTFASNLGVGVPDLNGVTNLVVRDMSTATSVLVDINNSATRASGFSHLVTRDYTMTPDARYVAFSSGAFDIAGSDTNGVSDVFLRDLRKPTAELVSVSADGTTTGNRDSSTALVSSVDDTGRFVLFRSRADNLGPADPGDEFDVYLRDMTLGKTTLLSRSSSGGDGGNAASSPSVGLARNGTVAMWNTNASDLGPADAGSDSDVYATAIDFEMSWCTAVRDDLRRSTDPATRARLEASIQAAGCLSTVTTAASTTSSTTTSSSTSTTVATSTTTTSSTTSTTVATTTTSSSVPRSPTCIALEDRYRRSTSAAEQESLRRILLAAGCAIPA